MITYKKTYQYRLRPTPEQLAQIENASGAVRFVYNWGTNLVRKASEKREPIPNYYVLAKNLTSIKRESDKLWLKEVYNATLQNSLKDLDLSVKSFFREIKKKNRVGLPGFRRKGFNDSMRFSSGIKHAKGKFYLPKIGFISYYDSRPLVGKIKQASVCKIIDKWFINVVCDVPISTLMPIGTCYTKEQESANRVCSINLGAGFLDKVLLLDGTLDKPKKNRKKKAKKVASAKGVDNANGSSKDANLIDLNESQVEMAKETRGALRALCQEYTHVFMSINQQQLSMSHNIHVPHGQSASHIYVPRSTKQQQANRLLVRRQKKLSRRIKNSKNKEKARVILEKQHLKIRRRRHDFLHKLSWGVVNKFDSITVKKYDLKRIMLSAYTPLAKVLREKAWDKFIQYLSYKCMWYGKNFVLT